MAAPLELLFAFFRRPPSSKTLPVCLLQLDQVTYKGKGEMLMH